MIMMMMMVVVVMIMMMMMVVVMIMMMIAAAATTHTFYADCVLFITSLSIATTLGGSTIIVPILWMRELRHRKVSNLPKATQLVNGGDVI